MSRRAAFTLVELLVVAGIFASLFGLVLAGVRPGAGGEVRRAAQSIVSVILATQGRALGNPAGAGLILQTSGSIVSTGTTLFTMTTLSSADMLPFITGSCTGAFPTDSSRNSISTTGTVTPNNAATSELDNGYKIRFWRDPALTGTAQPMSPWFAVQLSGSVGEIRFRTVDGQSLQNTIWPEPFASGSMCNVVVARYPNQGETLLDLPKNVAIDPRYSGVGDGSTFTTLWSALSNKGAIAITFDTVGGLDCLMQMSRAVQPLHPTEAVYLLVNSVDWMEKSIRVPLEYPPLGNQQALWVTIHPQTGRVSVSSNVPQTQTVMDLTDLDVLRNALRAARAKARAQAVIGK